MSKPPAADAPAPRPGLAAELIAWFDRSARDLPWRTNRTGYRVWVSEIMLQQTRVSTVIPYYERFLAAFPTLRDLAAADIEQVLALWSGLGYYRRARGLHEGARDVVARFQGELPADVEQLLSIKGIGPYTAGAIASLAFGIQTPLVDGNVIRVLARLFAIQEDARQARVQKQIWALAGSLVPQDRPGAFNEALMELGATTCLPQQPLCLLCPLAPRCDAHRLGLAASLPLLAPPRAPTLVHAASLVARRERQILLGRRRPDALFGGLWEPPTVEASSPDEAADLLARFASRPAPAGEVQHTLSHRKMRVAVFTGDPAPQPGYPPVYDEVRWVQEGDLHLYGISTLAKKLMKKGGA
ncbi:MAG: A/G-specific adenine glycosylase [Polyangiaceae bacterium]|jgi:A/G-specific adenine glycosylase|nr:A/G-specific adenine glycosylase [Polyangiaceae bacterium]